MKTHFSGKAYTAFLLIFLGITILASAEIFSHQLLNILIISALIFSIFFSLLDYFRDPGVRLLKKVFWDMKQQSLNLKFQDYIYLQDMQTCSFFEEILTRCKNFIDGNGHSMICLLYTSWRCRRWYACRSRWSPYH